MNIKMIASAAALLAGPGTTVAQPFDESDTPRGWAFHGLSQDVTYERYDHGRDRKVNETTTITGVALSTTDGRKPLTVLACAPAVGLSAKVTSRPTDLEDTGYYAFGRRKSSFGELFVAGERVRANQWAIDTTDGSMVTFDAQSVAYLYDAAMKGLTVRLDLENKSAFDIHLPQADESFPQFVAACPFLNPPPGN